MIIQRLDIGQAEKGAGLGRFAFNLDIDLHHGLRVSRETTVWSYRPTRGAGLLEDRFSLPEDGLEPTPTSQVFIDWKKSPLFLD
jgi:hypothetical protein